ncbi:MAG: PQQ-binding-like beta-propeller repeat protein [Phycisphaerales bacterium]|nr:PQQ-binding-like beta-propeller repeat protein [Phycisphaerales bacterium]MCB9857689.1 PQQ-binding-like beta-propeller repeat protein [Phycisphaerales bacterium]MCB9864778.1 PQQ-binding-like beta-propeller repeat protein [Phycisphaerales bacterium]
MSACIFRASFIVAALLAMFPSAGQAQSGWPTLAGAATRGSVANDVPSSLSLMLWQANVDLTGRTLVFEGPASPIVYESRAYANARHFNASNAYVSNKVVAFDASTGAIVFETEIAKGVLDSWSSPTLDAATRTILIASGNSLFGIDADSGDLKWETPLDRSVVNATVVAADDVSHGRAFITDYTGFGVGASLYCVNTSAFDAIENPFEPGDIVWQEAIGGASGATPSYRDGVVYVACTAEPTTPSGQQAGHISAYDVDAPVGQRLLWRATLASAGVSNQGFFGGVAIVGDHVYAASYNSAGSGDNSTLVKIRASDGAIVWTIPCERTNSIPIVAAGRVYLSAGLLGFGSVPKVQAFEDLGASAMKLWDTYVDSAGTLFVGGWTHQPVYMDGLLYCGVVPSGFPFFGPNTDMYSLDVTRAPSDIGFVVEHVAGLGGSPAVCEGTLYTTGAAGMFALATKGDVCGGDGRPDGAVTIEDAACFAAMLVDGTASSSDVRRGDFNDDGMLDGRDVAGFIAALTGE